MEGPLYKYLPPERIDVLRNKRIRISQPCALNDPHDALVSVRSRLEEQSGQERVIKDNFSVERYYAQRIREDLSRQIGVISFSAVPLDTLMWAHYAESHAGFMLHVNPNSSFFRRTLTWVGLPYGSKKVYEGLPYPSEVAYSNHKESTYIEDGVQWDFLFRKSLAWKYEKEFRSLMNLTDGEILEGTDKLRWPVHLAEIPEDTIVGVTIGLASGPDLEEEILSICSERGISAFKVSNDHLSYELIRHTYDRSVRD